MLTVYMCQYKREKEELSALKIGNYHRMSIRLDMTGGTK